MIWIKPTETISLFHDYGGLWWDYEDGQLYGIEAYGDGGKRAVRRILDEETVERVLRFPSAVDDGQPVMSADFVSGQLGILITRCATAGIYQRSVPTIHWFESNVNQAVAHFNLYGGASSFTRTPGDYPHTYFIFQFSDSDGYIHRWNSVWTTGTPETYHQMASWRSLYGQIRSFGVQDFEDVTTPSRYLIAATQTGEFRWIDTVNWVDNTKIISIYKTLGVLKCQSVSDITLDRANNLLWILDSGKKLHLVELEPFGTELPSYENTAVAVKMMAADKEISPGATTKVYAQVLDMWGQPIERSNINVDFIAGDALGKFYDAESQSYKTKAVVKTESTGVAEATYRADNNG